MTDLLSVTNLIVGQRGAPDPLVRGVSLTIKPGEILGLVGESGSGKTLTASAIAGLLPQGIDVLGGEIQLNGERIERATARRRRELFRNQVGFVFQNAITTLNPRLSIYRHIVEASPNRSRRFAAELLRDVGIDEPEHVLRSYPHELSGGLSQRVMIATAIARKPQLLVADEPTTALDVTIQATVLDLIEDIRNRLGLSVLLISHDIGVVAERCDRVAVMHEGIIVDEGYAATVLNGSTDGYTQRLLASRPSALRLKGGLKGDGQSSSVPSGADSDPLLSVHSVSKSYSHAHAHGRRAKQRQVLEPVDIAITPESSIGIVGESGSGKTTLARIIAGLTPPDTGTVSLGGTVLDTRRKAGRNQLWDQVQYVFQNTTGSLDPRLDVASTLRLALGAEARTDDGRVPQLLADVGLDTGLADRIPAELSGGQRQRLVIARALARDPRLLVADEPVSALDLTVQAHILRLLQRLHTERSMALVLISHDLEVVRELCDEVLVIARGRVVERGATANVFDSPQHPYTRTLLESIPGSRIRRTTLTESTSL